MQTDPPPRLKSGHLDIKDAQCAKKYDGRKISYHIISRLGAAAVQKCVLIKINFSLKVIKFTG